MRELAEINIQQFVEHFGNHLFGGCHHFLFIHKGSFDIDLGKLRLTLCTKVFVAEALHDLVVTVKAGHHQQLLEQLWRLRQCVERALVHTAWHQIVTCTFWGCTGQNRCFDIQKAFVFQVVAYKAGGLAAHNQLFLHLRTTEIHITVTQTHIFAYVGVAIQLERRCLGFVEDFHLFTQHFNFTGWHIGINSAFGARTHPSSHFQHIFTTGFISQCEGFFCIRVDHNLSDTFPISQIKKDNTTVVTATMHPTTESNCFAVMAQI